MFFAWVRLQPPCWSLRILGLATGLLLGGCTTLQPQHISCRLRPADRAWLDRSVAGWIAARRDLLEADAPAEQRAIIFDPNCQLSSRTAMTTGRPDWAARVITGKTIRVGGQELPIGVISATIGDDTSTQFVMSVPSVWADKQVRPGPLGLERLMSAVLVHEATHVFQMETYGAQIDALQKANALSDELFNDDAIQARFGSNADFAASIKTEIDLFSAAASAVDDGEARRLASTARAMMRARGARFFVDDQSYQNRAEDLWLTMEGSAQWAGFGWLQLPLADHGGGASLSNARDGFGMRGDAWTQQLGLAITLAVDRLNKSGWKRHIFGDGKLTLLEVLDRDLEQPHLTSGQALDPRVR